MIERLFHEPGKGLRAAILNLVANELDQSAISSLRPQRPTFNVQLSTLNSQLPELTWNVGRLARRSLAEAG